ncbi:hypothetical protein [Yinghuangia sp. YIM S09857]|uniref:hypothetical protein n=1 Tax=Yinghuangia sp. YIM S09857 TaxID=3436929 RepID=UPI003F53B408
MYLVFALLAPIGMFGLIWGLTWFEDRMLGPAAGREVSRPGRATPDAVPQPAPEAVASEPEPETKEPAAKPSPAPIPLHPLISIPAVSPLPTLAAASAAAVTPAPTPVRHHLRRTLKRGRGRLRAA